MKFEKVKNMMTDMLALAFVILALVARPFLGKAGDGKPPVI